MAEKKVGRPKGSKITPRQEKFCQLVATGTMTNTEAARQAGLSDVPVTVSKLLRNPVVATRIADLQAHHAQKYEVTFEKHVMKLAEIRDAALEKGNFTAAVAAEKSRGQAAGLYVSRQEIMVGKIDQMSKEEVLAELAKLQAEFPALTGGGLVIDGDYSEVNDPEEEDDEEGEDIDYDDDEEEDGGEDEDGEEIDFEVYATEDRGGDVESDKGKDKSRGRMDKA